jgi:putative zinc finger/helix-turn-helix YgiT family protein
MKCVLCGGSATKVRETKKAKYRGEVVKVVTELFRCSSCGEGFVAPEQARTHIHAVKNEVRKKDGLLPPEKITAIREKLGLTQSEMEAALGIGPKMVVRWESGKVIQSKGHDNTLRLLDSDPSLLKSLLLIQKRRSAEQKQYEKSHSPAVTEATV